MWELDDASVDGNGNFMTLTFDVSNLTLIEHNAARGVKALYPLSWTVAQPKKCYAPVKHQQTTPDGYFDCVMIDPNYESRWNTTWAQIAQQVHKKQVVGVFLGDEHLYFGVQLDSVKKIADTIRRDWPDAIIYMNEAPDVAMCNYRKDNTSIFETDQCLPQNVDWFGFDFYADDSTSWTAVEEANANSVFPRMSRPDQRVVPTSLGYAEGNFTREQVAAWDDVCTRNAIQFLRYGLGERRVVGMFPFHWKGGQVQPDGSVVGGLGIENAPRCKAAYQAQGQLIKAAGPDGTSEDLALQPPRPDAHGAFPEPLCRTPIPAAPSVWTWCSRVNPPSPSA